MPLRLEDFDVSPERGFLPDQDPLTELPTGWEFLDQVGNELPELIESGRILTVAKTLPIPPPEAFDKIKERERELRLIWKRYSHLQSAYVKIQDETKGPVVICKNLAGPVCNVSELLDMPPILQYAPYALWNWKRKDPLGPIVVDNLELIQTFSRAPDQSWFILIHNDIENKAGLAINSLWQNALGEMSPETTLLNTNLSLDGVIATMKRMPEHTTPDTYDKIRKWIMFFHSVIYEGVGKYGGQPQTFPGQTGAQTSFEQAVEAGLQMPPLDKNNRLAVFLMQMRGHMPKKHREFVDYLENISRVRDVVCESAPYLIDLYDRCVEQLLEFLAIHYGYATFYIFKKTGQVIGTGGSPYLIQLRGRIEERWEKCFIRKRTEQDCEAFIDRQLKMVEELVAA